MMVAEPPDPGEFDDPVDRLEAFAAAFPDLAFIVSRDGRILDYLAGELSEELLHVEPPTFLGRPVDEILPPPVAEECLSHVEAAIEERTTQSFEYQLGTPRGDRWFEARIEPLPNDVSGTQSVIWLARDVTDRRRQQRVLERQNERLERFASVVSHDLRSPLTVAQGRVALAAAEADSEHLSKTRRALDRMERIVEDLLTLARLGDDIGATEPIDLDDVVRASWGVVAGGTETATLEVRDGLGTVHADGNRLRQLFENLVRNAIEHAGAGVSVTVGPLDDGFYVEDDGPGVPETARQRVFEAGYSTGDESTGLGLNIVEDVVEAHGWRVAVTDAEDGGARFEITGVERDAP